MEGSHRFSRINLHSNNITELDVIATFPYTDDRVAALEGLPALDLPQLPFFISTMPYRPRGGVRHVANLAVMVPPLSRSNETIQSKETIQVLLSYATEFSRDLFEAHHVNRREADLWAAVLNFGIPTDLTGTVQFSFPGRGGDDLWFPLPVSLAGSKEPEDVFEIRSVSGVKLSKAKPGDRGYRFTISCPFGKDVSLRMSFDFEGVLHPSIVRMVLRQAVRLAPDLVPTA